MRKLLNAVREGLPVQKVRQVAPFMREGLSIAQALSQVDQLRYTQLEFFTNQREVKRLEKKTGRSINDLLIECLEKHSGLTISRSGSRSGMHVRPREAKRISRAS